jgi:hypothetical protein
VAGVMHWQDLQLIAKGETINPTGRTLPKPPLRIKS